MTKLSDTQAVILSAASQRDDGAVLPLPETLRIKGGAVDKVLGSLKAKGLIRVIGGDGGPERVVITSEGMAAIGVEADDDEAPTAADTGATSAGTDGAAEAPASATEADVAPTPAKSGRAKGKAKAAPPASGSEADAQPTAKPTPRAGTKQAEMIEMLTRPEGATVEQIAQATGWQRHTIRGAISGALKKKLGLTVEATRTREVGPNQSGAKGSSTVYRITGSSPAAG
jgi:predicted ArsR family transcriptional regulator